MMRLYWPNESDPSIPRRHVEATGCQEGDQPNMNRLARVKFGGARRTMTALERRRLPTMGPTAMADAPTRQATCDAAAKYRSVEVFWPHSGKIRRFRCFLTKTA
jgi:hypothetical protein